MSASFPAYHGSATTSSDNVQTIPLSGAGKVRVRTIGDDIFYALWGGTTNAAAFAEISTGGVLATLLTNRIYKLGVTNALPAVDNLQVEIRASDGTTLKARGYIASIPSYGAKYQEVRDLAQGSGIKSIITFVTSEDPATALAAGDTLFWLAPSKTNARGLYLRTDAHDGVVIDLAGRLPTAGAIAFCRAGSSANATVVVERLVCD